MKKTYSGRILDVQNNSLFTGEVTVEDGRVTISPTLTTHDDTISAYILPGFIDSHIHIESSMVTPQCFAQMAVRHGTVGVCADPHEIANVCGEDGIDFMTTNGRDALLHFCWGLPSCVPALGGNIETCGCTIDAEVTERLIERENISFLSEMMNFVGVVNDDSEVIRKINAATVCHKPIDGHSPGLSGDALTKYIRNSGGMISTDHECSTPTEAIERMRQGMYVLLREGTAAKNFDALISLVDKKWTDVEGVEFMGYERMMLCSDDLHPQDLQKGHINALVKRAMRGREPERNKEDMKYLMMILHMACVNPVKHYNMDIGLLQNGDNADFIVVDNLVDFNVLDVIINGKSYAGEDGTHEKQDAIDAINNFHALTLTEADIAVVPSDIVITAADGSLLTGSSMLSEASKANKIVVYNRYEEGAKPAVAWIEGFAFECGAIAQSIAHDCHNIVAVGSDDDSILRVINKVVEMQGGMAAYCYNNISLPDDAKKKGSLVELPLPIGGLMSKETVSVVAEKYRSLLVTAHEAGSPLHDPYLTLGFMSLPVIPNLKLTDKGLFDVTTFQFV